MDEDEDVKGYSLDDEQPFTISFDHFGHMQKHHQSAIDALSNSIRSGLSLDKALSAMSKFKMRIDLLDRFKLIVMIYHNKFNANELSVLTLDQMMDSIPKIKFIENRSPIGFVIGAMILNRDRHVDRARFDTVVNSLESTLKIEDISKEDVLRYGRMWERVLHQK